MADTENVPKNAAQLISKTVFGENSVQLVVQLAQLQFYKVSQNGLIPKSGNGNNLGSGM